MNQNIFAYEVEHLALTVRRLESELHRMRTQEDTLSQAFKEANLYLKEEMGSAPGDFLQAVEFSQTLQVEKQLLEQRGYQDKRYLRYQRLLQKPYFARIDYQERGDSQVEVLYIGYGNFMDDQTLEIYIYDWRTPVASVFYDFQTGPVHYAAPDGMIFGQVSLKRQYDIKNSTLIAYHDTQSHIADDRLLEALASRKAGPMHQIVETIQAEQNSIIREKKASAVFVEGIAGSGKTVVALHRIAYLLYHGLKNSLTSQQVLVLSPNDLFSHYIAHVIPELGEEQVQTSTLSDILAMVLDGNPKGEAYDEWVHHLPGLSLESPYSRLERDLTRGLSEAEHWAMTIKQSTKMQQVLDRWLAKYVRQFVEYEDFYYAQNKLSSASAMKAALKEDAKGRPLMKRLGRFTQRVRHRVKDFEKAYYAELLVQIMVGGNHPFDYKAAARLERYKTYRALSKRLEALEGLSALSVYRALLEHPGFWREAFEHMALKDAKAMCDATLLALDQGRMSIDDWVLVAYLHQMMHGDHVLAGVRQVVVDESQDYSPMTYALLRALFGKAHFTVLGDNHQTLHDERTQEYHQQIASILGFEDTQHRALTVAYRNSEAIGRLCLELFSTEHAQQHYGIVPRKGHKPEHYKGPLAIEKALNKLKKAGHETIAIIAKSMDRAKQICKSLEKSQPVVLLDPDSVNLPKGILVMPVYLAKGMEFDGVIIVDADDSHYHTERDRQLLYVGASRALHDLCIVSEGEITSLLKDLV